MPEIRSPKADGDPNVGIDKAEEGNTDNSDCRDIFDDGYETPDINEFLADVAKRFCPECGIAFPRNHIGRPKAFCCEACRRKWWHEHPNPLHWKSTKLLTCPVCGKIFIAVRAEKEKRKYCSRACANKGKRRNRIFDDGTTDFSNKDCSNTDCSNTNFRAHSENEISTEVCLNTDSEIDIKETEKDKDGEKDNDTE